MTLTRSFFSGSYRGGEDRQLNLAVTNVIHVNVSYSMFEHRWITVKKWKYLTSMSLSQPKEHWNPGGGGLPYKNHGGARRTF